MKKVLLIGKFNETVKDINEYLSPYFQVQLCSDNAETEEGMLKIFQPDAVVVSLIGMYDGAGTIFFQLWDKYPETPVLTIGTEGECRGYLKYYQSSQFENLIRPVNNADIKKKLFEKLGIDESAAERAAEAAREKSAAASGDTKKTILVVDDNATVLRSCKAMLQEFYQIVLASSGLQAMTAIGRRRPDLILLDYEMPVCDGKMTLEMIRQDESIGDIPVIFLTGVADKEHIEAVLRLRPAGYLLKPAEKERLLKTIREVIGE